MDLRNKRSSILEYMGPVNLGVNKLFINLYIDVYINKNNRFSL